MKKSVSIILFALFMLTSAYLVAAQRKRPTTQVKEPATQTTPTPIPDQNEQGVKPQGKKNSRPGAGDSSNPLNTDTSPSSGKPVPVYSYEFSQPEFFLSKVTIEHDEKGQGTIRFVKKFVDEEISEPVQLSGATLERVTTLWQKLDFLDSDENYQYERDYAHLGTVRLTMKKDDRRRTAEFNWTAVPDAKALAEEYRRIGNQLTWVFEINVARENQPLESARIMDALDMRLRRNEIADPVQLLPFLKELSEDERMPLISRNHALRMTKAIKKDAAKKAEKTDALKDQ